MRILALLAVAGVIGIAALTIASTAGPKMRLVEADPAPQPTSRARVPSPAASPRNSDSDNIDTEFATFDDSDILAKVLLTLAIAGGAAIIALAGYVIRRRVGFWPHRPPPRNGGRPEEHH